MARQSYTETVTEAAPAEATATPSPVPETAPVDPVAKGFDLQLIRTIEVGSTRVRLAPANSRPPGSIADQSTSNEGAWLQIDDQPWRKVAPSFNVAAKCVATARTMVGALKRLGV